MKLAKFIPEIKIVPNNIQEPKLYMKFLWEGYGVIRQIIDINPNNKQITDMEISFPYTSGILCNIDEFKELQREGKIKIIK